MHGVVLTIEQCRWQSSSSWGHFVALLNLCLLGMMFLKHTSIRVCKSSQLGIFGLHGYKSLPKLSNSCRLTIVWHLLLFNLSFTFPAFDIFRLVTHFTSDRQLLLLCWAPWTARDMVTQPGDTLSCFSGSSSASFNFQFPQSIFSTVSHYLYFCWPMTVSSLLIFAPLIQPHSD